MNRCSAKNRFGRRCHGFAVDGSAFCFWHDPRNAQKRLQARRLGGHHSRAPASLALAHKESVGRRAAEQEESHTRRLSLLQNRHRSLG